MLPLPGFSRADLPGQAEYFLAQQAAAVDEGVVTLSIIARETLSGWLMLLVPIAVYLLTRATSVRTLQKLACRPVSLATPIGPEGDVELGSLIPDRTAVSALAASEASGAA
mgnify:CR=1 FL=1